jgi:hypothetical protein
MVISEDQRRRSRIKLLLVIAVFLGPAVVAAVLSVTGWQPRTRGHGEPILPQRNFADATILLSNGSLYPWRAATPQMTLVALPSEDCATRCLHTLALMRNARIALNQNQRRLRLLYLGTPPTGAEAKAVMREWFIGSDVHGRLDGFRPMGRDTVSAILVESNGTALALYRAGFDPRGLSKDLQRVIH